MRFEPLLNHHDRKGFDCGEQVLNQWLQRQALQSQRKRTASTSVVVEHDKSPVILGFYALTVTFVRAEHLPTSHKKGLPSEVPVFLLARLAVDINHRSRDIGVGMLFDAFERTRLCAEVVGGIGLMTHAKPAAEGFYEANGFVRLLDTPNSMLLFFDK
jgi:hypothetical protein